VADPFFYRAVTVSTSETGKEKTFRNLNTGILCRIPQLPEPVLALEISPAKYQYVQIRIQNQDNPELSIRKVELVWLRHSLYFFPLEGKTYTLYYGNQEAELPRYETTNLIRQGREQLLTGTLWKGEVISENQNYEPGVSQQEKAKLQQALLVGLVILLTGVLGFWIISMVRKVGVGEKPADETAPDQDET
jgi:hypothetical protein